MFNDILGTTLGTKGAGDYAPITMTAFGETEDKSAFFTGKPAVGELGYAFLFRNYRANLGKWQTADPLGYPDGWNNLAYCGNCAVLGFDALGLAWDTEAMNQHYLHGEGMDLTLSQMGLKDAVWGILNSAFNPNWEKGGEWWNGIYLPYQEGSGKNPTGFMSRMRDQVTEKGIASIDRSKRSGFANFSHNVSNGYNFSPLVWAMGGGSIHVLSSSYTINWELHDDGYFHYTIEGVYNVSFYDVFEDPVEVPNIEWGDPYVYTELWLNQSLELSGTVRE